MSGCSSASTTTRCSSMLRDVERQPVARKVERVAVGRSRRGRMEDFQERNMLGSERTRSGLIIARPGASGIRLASMCIAFASSTSRI